MTWSRMLGYLLAGAGLRWIAQHFLPNADAYLAAGVIGLWLVLAFHRRTRGYFIADAINRGTDDEREALLTKLQPKRAAADVEAETLELEEALANTLTFRYPEGSRSFTTFQFWLCVLFSGGFLAPLALGRVTELGDGWILFLLGSGSVLASAGHRRRLGWLGTELSVSPDALIERRSNGHVYALPWSKISAVRTRRWSRALEFQTADTTVVAVWPELIAHEQFLVLAGEHLRDVRQRAA